MKKPAAYDIAFAGISSAATVILLLLSSFLPTARIASFVICALPMYLPLTRKKYKLAAVIYAASSILVLLIAPNKLEVLPYPLFIAPFALIQIALKDKNAVLNYAVKFLFFNAVAIGSYFILNSFIDLTAIINAFNVTKFWAAVLLWLFANIVFFLYDYATLLLFPKMGKLYDRIDKTPHE